jgi:hypothetical protein
MLKFVYSHAYDSSLRAIEDFIFETTQDVRFVDQFLNEHDHTLAFIAKNPETPPLHPETGDRSWVTSSGQYRIFYLPTPDAISLTDIIDNRRANLNVYPGNSMPTFDIDD